jgi:L-aspartate oxidase
MSEQRYDFLVVGSGLAGLLFALEAASRGRVAILTKRLPDESNTLYAQGGIASVSAADDSFEQHTADTLVAGAGLCRPDVVAGVVAEGPRAIETLERYGVKLTASENGGYDLGREGGHSRRRILHAKDRTGRAIGAALLERARADQRIQIFPHHCCVDLITDSKLAGRRPAPGATHVAGAYALDARAGEIRTFRAPQVLLATGGAGKVYRYTSNPDVATGDGLAMAYRAGARLANLEFVQFHPTCLYEPRGSRFLISEALRGEGAVLKSISGEPFMDAYHPLGSLAPRDIVARAIDQEMKRRGDRHVVLDLTGIGRERVKSRFPMIYATCLEQGIDIAYEPVPVVPAAHYMCGGVVTDAAGRTDLVGLYAAGEVACTGLHGANRLASNSLLEAAVFALRAARAAGEALEEHRARAAAWSPPAWNPGQATVPKESVLVNAHWEMVRALMWDFVGIVRSDHRLAIAERYIALMRESVEQYYWDFILDSDLIELRNLALVAQLIIRSAAVRRESRGLHYNVDHPATEAEEGRRESLCDPVTGETRLIDAGEVPFGDGQG